MKKIIAILFLTTISAYAGATTITATNITDLTGQKVPAARLCFTPEDAAGNAIGFMSGTAQVTPSTKCGLVSNGQLQSGFTVYDSSETTPLNIRYHVTLVSILNVSSVICDYGVTTITGTSWSLNSYDSKSVVLPAYYGDSQTGSLTVNDDLSVSGSAVFDGKVTLEETPSSPSDATSKAYVDAAVSSEVGSVSIETARAEAAEGAAQTTANAALPANGCSTTSGGNLSCATVAATGAVSGANITSAGNITGTATNITATSNATVTNLPNLATVGTITSGVWNGGILGAAYGGTGFSTSNSTGIPQISSGTWSVFNASCTGAANALTYSGGLFGCNSAINAYSLGGASWASPGSIGSTTPNTGRFTELSLTGGLTLAASTTSAAGVNLGVGTAPQQPTAGDLWATTSGIYAYINGGVVGPFGAGGGSGGSGTVASATAYSPAYYPSTGTAVAGVTPFDGLAYYSTSTVPTAATSTQVLNSISSTPSSLIFTTTAVNIDDSNQGVLSLHDGIASLGDNNNDSVGVNPTGEAWLYGMGGGGIGLDISPVGMFTLNDNWGNKIYSTDANGDLIVEGTQGNALSLYNAGEITLTDVDGDGISTASEVVTIQGADGITLQAGTRGVVLSTGTNDNVTLIAQGNTTAIFPASSGTLALAGQLPIGGTITFTTATSDSATISGISTSSYCVLFPANSAATATTILPYVSSVAANTITIAHAASVGSGAKYNVVCTYN